MRGAAKAGKIADQLYVFPSLLSKADPATVSEYWRAVSLKSISSSPPWGVRWLPKNKNDHLTPGVLHRVMLAVWQSDFVKLGNVDMDRGYSNVCHLELATCHILLVMDDSVQLAQSPNALSMGVFPRPSSVEHQAEYVKALRWLFWLVHDAVHHIYHREVRVNNLCERCADAWPIKCNNSENGGQVEEMQLHRPAPIPDQPLGGRLRTRYHDDVCFLRLSCMHDVDKYEPRGAYELLETFIPPVAPPPVALDHPDLSLAFPEMKDADHLDPKKLCVDLLLMVVTDVEFFAVMRKLRRLPGHEAVLRGTPNLNTYLVGVFGVYRVALVQCGMGGGGTNGATLVANRAVAFWHPKAVIMVGIAFGLLPAKQDFGDVLVSSQLASYNLQRVTGPEEAVTYRGTIAPGGAHLAPRFRAASTYDWMFARADGRPCKVLCGQVLSGDVLVDSLTYGARLLGQFPNALGGEMEGHGVSAACLAEGAQWIVVKAVCDFAGMDGQPKRKEAQSFAAAAATSLVHHVLSRHCLGGLDCVAVRSGDIPSGDVPVAGAPALASDSPRTRRFPRFLSLLLCACALLCFFQVFRFSVGQVFVCFLISSH
jgi:nucleoside phosphorylase